MTASDARTAELATRLEQVRGRLDAATAAADRPRGDVDLLVVTKFFPADDVARLIALGETQFGESREPEASRKVAALHADADLDARFSAGALAVDMIGSVQTKKAKTVARWARSVHSVDREKLADRLGAEARTALDTGDRHLPLGVFLQVSLDGDVSRGGVVEDGLEALAERVAADDALRLRGLMTIAPLDGEPERWMAEMARIRESFLAHHPDATELSAGMSGDLESAVAHGSTCVRVGTAIMGPRPILSQ
ncbi:YggS family pyridoxal phosphate-dependent enzyme [Gordonia sinesedis]